MHEGRAFIAFDDRSFGERLETLRVVVTVCLRLMAGLPPGGELQQYISERGVS